MKQESHQALACGSVKKYIADYDVWTFAYGDNTKAFEKGFTLHPHEPTDGTWEYLCDWECSHNDTSLVKEIIHRGKTIIAYRKAMMADYCSHTGFDAILDGHKVFAVNMAMISSDDFINSNTWILRYLYLRGNVFFPFLSFV